MSIFSDAELTVTVTVDDGVDQENNNTQEEPFLAIEDVIALEEALTAYDDEPKEQIAEAEVLKDKQPKVKQTEVQLPAVKEVSSQSSQLNFVYIVILLVFIALLYLLLKLRKKLQKAQEKEFVCEEQLQNALMKIEAKEKIISHLSYEFRTPMNSIVGLTHLVLESDLPKQQKAYIQKIEKSSKQLIALVDDVVDLSKIKSGKTQLDRSEFNINDIITYTLDTNTIAAQKHNVTLALDIAKDVPSKIVGDSVRLGQVLINLVSHSIETITNGYIEIFVDVVETYNDRVRLQFRIVENGKKLQERTSTQKEGFGISIAQDYIEMMGGRIKTVPTHNGLNSFVFELYFGLRDGQNKRQYRLPSKKLLNKNILIVEPSNRNAIQLIKFFGYFHYKTKVISSFEDVMFDEDLNYENGSKYHIVVINQHAMSEYGIKKIQEFKKRSPQMKVVLINELYSEIEEKYSEMLTIDATLKMPATQQSVLNLIITLYVNKNLDKRSRKKTIKDKLRVLKNKKVLLVEDNEINQKVIAELLISIGVELTCVSDGKEALEYVDKGVMFDLILMDLNMPNIDGYEAAKKIRINPLFNAIPIIAISGDTADEVKTKALESGMQAYLSKPLDVEKFYHLLYKYFKAQKSDFAPSKKFVAEVEKQETPKKEFKKFVNLDEEVFTPAYGLKRCHGDKEFYKTILQEFIELYNTAPTQLFDLCREKKFKEARHLAMDIKDVSLNIGAYKVYESAASMEYELEKGARGNYKEHISHFAKALQEGFFEIKKYLKTLTS